MGESRGGPELIKQFVKAVKHDDFSLASELLPLIHSLPDESHVRLSRDVPLLAWEDSKYGQTCYRNYLFVSGTARSGTTAMGVLLNTHPRLAIFTELYSHAFGYHPKIFSLDNIRKLQSRALLPDPLSPRNLEIYLRLDQCSDPEKMIVGDKRPNFLRSVQLTLQSFSDQKLTLIHIVRPIEEVAWSYGQRCIKGTWSAQRDYKRAVQDSNYNNEKILNLAHSKNKNVSIVILDYHSFWSTSINAYNLFEELRLPREEIDDGRLLLLFDKYQSLKIRKRDLPVEATEFIRSSYDYEAEHRILSLLR